MWSGIVGDRGLSPNAGRRQCLLVHVGRQRRLPKVVSGLLLPIPMRMRSVTLIASVSAVAVGPVRIPSPM